VRTILLLAANPRGTEPLSLPEEIKKVQQIVEPFRQRGEFEVVVSLKPTDEDLRRALLYYKPEIVHFSGHGTGQAGTGSTRELGASPDTRAGGLAFENELGGVLTISGEALAGLFALSTEPVKCVVLNACYSATEAQAIARHVDCVIGMNKAIGDKAAVKFSGGFYDAIVAGKPFDIAFEFGRNAIELCGIPEHLTPTLMKKQRSASRPSAVVSSPPPLVQPRPTEEVTRRSERLMHTPAPAASRLSAGAIDPSDLNRVQRALRKYIGPLADFIVEEKAKEAHDLADLCRRVATEIETAGDREGFLRSLRKPG
jgi:hypothetical protein